ncbi:MAG TPA: hypothetical protein VFH73_21810, partial [Polyangia bacterium]|nr:hypothetical protein [Polyangia bacterium]
MVLMSGCGGGDGGDGGSPITERPSRAAYTCSVARGVTEYAPRTWQSSPALVVSSGGAAYLLRIESMPT